ncbi:GAF domain-containing protein [Egicoccus sp. AB-alg2]|uniref:GAF domain-containing protein n=1 Tax=Egicoccus sp. AB-alg2 TaxID=3242693 RepID=UPI00359DB411
MPDAADHDASSTEPVEDHVDLIDRPDAGYASALSRLGGLLIDEEDLEVVLRNVVEAVRLAVPGLTSVSVTTIDEEGGYTTAVASDPRAQAVDELEYAQKEGPCVVALETGEEQLVRDVRSDDRWAAFNEAALDNGFHAVAGIPLQANGHTYGALNLFAAAPGGIDEDTMALCRRLATPVGAALANARAFRTSDRLSRQLQQRLHDIAVLHQAVGVLMADRDCDARTAAALLQRTAETTNRSLRDVAEQLVERVAEGG